MATIRSAWMTAWIPALSMLSGMGVQGPRPSGSCIVASHVSRLPGLAEASGVAVGRVLWSMNDSSGPTLQALDANGALLGRVRVTGAQAQDWEDLSMGACPQGTCIYIADIGDNRGRRDHITVYRVAEPAVQAGATEPAEAMHATYPDGPRDAEALFVTPQGRLFVVTKGQPGSIAVYGFPLGFHNGTTVRLERISALPMEKGRRSGGVTDAETSPDGRWVAIRTHQTVIFYRTSDLISGSPREAFRVDVTSLREPQGEGVAIGPGGDVYLVGENARAGTFARLKCTF